MSTTCFFNDCTHVVAPGSWKCDFHRNRSRCLVALCQNQVYARHLCVRHGGKRRCDVPDCDRNVRLGSLCVRHGAGSAKKQCTEAGCSNVAHKRQKCVRHGGGRQCHIDGCKTHARSGGYCYRHTRRMACRPPTLQWPPISTPLLSLEEHGVLDWKAVATLLDGNMNVHEDDDALDDLSCFAPTETMDVESAELNKIFIDFVVPHQNCVSWGNSTYGAMPKEHLE
ncbi:Aste57867_264 [Aphanomyces stellatus]|uniref:Aste57867_264 protein n=1 Tax=Aphanomyces stellatus TaxID=120398 RepID=A0A485K2L9_9STRA|nr:hypothetical protein As57867_000264 [Aphanomyces stellatus]VFT77490.1 Aste57867_264 [Aphanomyces stellatus]